MKTIAKPTIQKIETSMGTIYVFRNPINKSWLFNITLAKKNSLELDFRPNLALAKLAYTFALIAVVLTLFVGCESPTLPNSATDKGTCIGSTLNCTLGDGTIRAEHPKSCIESYPVVPDTIVKKLEAYSLKVGDGPRNRCKLNEDQEWIECNSKTKDTLWVIDTYCPATLKARNAMGGN